MTFYETEGTDWTNSHVWLHKQPLPLWSISSSIWLFGTHELAIRLPSLLLSTLCIWIMFLMGRELYCSRVGYLAAFLFATNGLIIELVGGRTPTDHVDIFFLCFILLGAFFALKHAKTNDSVWIVLCGASMGFAVLSKWLPALIIIPVWLSYQIHLKRRLSLSLLSDLLVLIASCAIICVPWQIFIYSNFPVEAQIESDYNWKHIWIVLDNQGGSVFYHLDKIRMVYGELVYLPMFWFLYRTLKKMRDMKRWSIVLWFWIPIIFFSMVATKMRAYTLFTAPAIFLMISLLFVTLSKYKNQFRFSFIAKLVLILLLILPLRFVIERIKPLGVSKPRVEQTAQIKSRTQALKGKKTVIFGVEIPIEIMFYTDAHAFQRNPKNKDNVMGLTKQGYTVYINSHVDRDSYKVDGVVYYHELDDLVEKILFESRKG